MRVAARLLALLACAAASAQQFEWRSPPRLGTGVGTALAFDAGRARTVMAYGSETWEWDGAVWRQVVAANPMGSRSFPGFAFDAGRGVTVLFAGQAQGGGAIGDTWEWNGAVWTQVATATAPSWRSYTAMAYDAGNQRVLLFGGNFGFPLGDTWQYDGANWTQLAPAASPSPRERHTLAYDAARAVTVLFGGFANSAQLDETWEWNGSTWLQRVTATRPPRRMNHAMAYDARRQVTVVFGGISTATDHADTWEWNGASWTQVAIGQPHPETGVLHEMCFDSARGEIVEFEDRTRGASTWTFAGGGWQVAAAPGDPGLRGAHRFAADPDRGEIVMYDGGWSTAAPPETWVHRTGQWLRRDPANQPATREDPALAFDPVTRRVLLFGGRSPLPTAETWLWDGANWQQAAPAASPPARSATAMASDTTRGRVVLFGGLDAAGVLGDTWEWDGATWSQQNPNTIPPSRKNHAMCFDPLRGRTSMFGGGDYLLPPVQGDHWEWDGTDWTPILGSPLPPGRAGAGLVYDISAQAALLVGGYYHLTFAVPIGRNDVWRWDGVQWTALAVGGPQPWPKRATPMACDGDTHRSLIHSGEGHRDTWLLGQASTSATTSYGTGCPGSFGVPELGATGLAVSGNRHFALQASALPPGGLVFFVLGLLPANVPLPIGCTALVAQVAFAAQLANARGAAVFAFPLPMSPAFQGLDVYAQTAAIDPGGAYAGIGALSAGLRIHIDR